MSILKPKAKMLIYGESGMGKSTSSMNLPIDKTLIINAENKILPFRHALKFKQVSVSNYERFEAIFQKALLSDKIEIIFIDSLYSLSEKMLAHCEGLGGNKFDVYMEYSNLMLGFLDSVKTCDKHIIITCLAESMESSDGRIVSYPLTHGRKLKGSTISSKFTVVLYSTAVKANNGRTRYMFRVNSSGESNAKSPIGMFDDMVEVQNKKNDSDYRDFVDNDAYAVMNEFIKYYSYSEDEQEETKKNEKKV